MVTWKAYKVDCNQIYMEYKLLFFKNIFFILYLLLKYICNKMFLINDKVYLSFDK